MNSVSVSQVLGLQATLAQPYTLRDTESSYCKEGSSFSVLSVYRLKFGVQIGREKARSTGLTWSTLSRPVSSRNSLILDCTTSLPGNLVVLPILPFSSLFPSLSITCFLLLEVAAFLPLPAQCTMTHREHTTCSGQQREKEREAILTQEPPVHWGWRVRLGLLREYNLGKTLNLS